MRETVLSRTAFVAAAGTALLTLVGCGGQRTQDATGFNDDRPVKDRMDAGAHVGRFRRRGQRLGGCVRYVVG